MLVTSQFLTLHVLKKKKSRFFEFNNTGGRRGCSWDAIILDEGHKIKTHSAKVTQAIRALPAKWRLLLTGTPIQV
jgi:SNF2 family DNA or RNA helicase